MPTYQIPTTATEERQEWEAIQFAQRIEHAPVPGCLTGLNFKDNAPLLREITRTPRMDERRELFRRAYAQEKRRHPA